jgi:pimeloyl-ACP methyl ester carboxylesterase
MHLPSTFLVDHNGARLAGDSLGAGPGLLFLHAGVADRRMWRRQIEVLGNTCQAVAYDRRGFGETCCRDVTFSHVDDLVAVMDRLGLDSACLVGCSQGGRVALDFALAHPRRATALVLVAPAISGAPEPQDFAPEIEARMADLEAAEAAGDIARVNAIEANLWLDGPTMPEARVAGELRELLLDMNAIALSHPELTGEIEPPSAYARLGEVNVPALVIWGTLDFPHIEANCHHLVETVPRARGIELDRAAHLPNLEQPDRMNRLLQDFLTEQGG